MMTEQEYKEITFKQIVENVFVRSYSAKGQYQTVFKASPETMIEKYGIGFSGKDVINEFLSQYYHISGAQICYEVTPLDQVKLPIHFIVIGFPGLFLFDTDGTEWTIKQYYGSYGAA